MNDSRFSNFLRYLVAIPLVRTRSLFVRISFPVLLSYSFVLGSELAALN